MFFGFWFNITITNYKIVSGMTILLRFELFENLEKAVNKYLIWKSVLTQFIYVKYFYAPSTYVGLLC